MRQGSRGWITLAACSLVRVKGGSQPACPYSSLIGVRSLPVAPPDSPQGCPIRTEHSGAPTLARSAPTGADSWYSYRATGDWKLSLSIYIYFSLTPPHPPFSLHSRECSASTATTLSPCTHKRNLLDEIFSVPAPSKRPWHQQSKSICISTGHGGMPKVHGLCISQLLKNTNI